MDLSNKALKVSVLLLLSLSLFLASSSFAGTYYVSPNGTNTWPNCTTADNPCPASSAHKEFLGANAGDTVYFLAGTYNPGDGGDYEHIAWNPINSGSQSSPITFKCLSGTCTLTTNAKSPVIGAKGIPGDPLNYKKYIIWDGFTASLSDQMFVAYFNSSDHCTLQNCDFTGWPNSTASNNPIIASGYSTYLTIRNNRFFGAGQTENSAAIMFYWTDNAIVENNEIYNCVTGIYDKAGGQGNVYRYNFIHSPMTSSLGYGAKGIFVQTAAGSETTDKISIYQNVILMSLNSANYASGIYIGGTLSRSYINIYNNTIYGSKMEEAIYTGDTPDPRAYLDHGSVFNNIIYIDNKSLRGLYAVRVTNYYSDYNNIYGSPTWFGTYGADNYATRSDWASRLSWDTNSVTTNPNFINAGGGSVTDYKRSSYPTNGRGGGYSNVIGAYITGNEVIGRNTPSGKNPPPNPPVGLVIINQ